jgi:hypothetical protein
MDQQRAQNINQAAEQLTEATQLAFQTLARQDGLVPGEQPEAHPELRRELDGAGQ